MTKRIEAKSSSSSSSSSSSISSKAQPSKAPQKASTSSSSKSSSSTSKITPLEETTKAVDTSETTNEEGDTPKATKRAPRFPKLAAPDFELPDNSIDKISNVVSNDSGELIENKKLEKFVISVCDKYGDLKTKRFKKAEGFIDQLAELVKKYSKHIDSTANSVGGTVTKYRIRQGMLFLILKKAVKAAKQEWKTWFKQNFSARELRSAQEYMKLAKVPGVMAYSVVGKDRLLKIQRLNGDGAKEASDPIGEFFKSKGIDFEGASGTDLDDFKFKVDVEINFAKLTGAGITEIPKTKVEELLTKGKQITSLHIKELAYVKAHPELGQTPGEYMQGVIDNGGKAVPVETPKRKAETFNGEVERFLKTIDTALGSTDVLAHISIETLKQLKSRIAKIERQMPRS
jgi:hypothetical protein